MYELNILGEAAPNRSSLSVVSILGAVSPQVFADPCLTLMAILVPALTVVLLNLPRIFPRFFAALDERLAAWVERPVDGGIETPHRGGDPFDE